MQQLETVLSTSAYKNKLFNSGISFVIGCVRFLVFICIATVAAVNRLLFRMPEKKGLFQWALKSVFCNKVICSSMFCGWESRGGVGEGGIHCLLFSFLFSFLKCEVTHPCLETTHHVNWKAFFSSLELCGPTGIYCGV